MATVGRETKFTTEISKEVKEFTWEIKNFGMVAASDEDIKNTQMNFNAGDTVGLPTEWQFYFRKHDDTIDLFLQLVKSPPRRTTVFANFRCKITNQKYQFPEIKDLSPKDYKSQPWGAHSFIPSLKEVPLNDNLVIRIQFVLHHGFEAESTHIGSELIKFRNESAHEITQHLGKLLESEDKADVTIKMKDGRTLKAHSAILIARSPVFAAMLKTDMTEASSGIVEVEDLSHEVMSIILQYLYTGKLGDKWEENLDEVIYAADKYEIMLLRKFCDKALGSNCTIENAWEMLTVAERHSMETAEREIKEFINNNIRGIIQATKNQRHQAKRIKLDLSKYTDGEL